MSLDPFNRHGVFAPALPSDNHSTPKGFHVNLRHALFALAAAAALVGASPTPKAATPAPAAATTTGPTTTQAPLQDAAEGVVITLTGFAQAQANGQCRLTYVLPLDMKLGSRAIVWACVR